MRQMTSDAQTGLLVNPTLAARMLGISPRTLWMLTNTQQVPHVRIGRCVRYPVDQLQAWIQQHTKGSVV